MTTKLTLDFDPTNVASAMKSAATEMLAAAKAADKLGDAAVGAANDLYGFESAEWRAADAAEKAERDVREFANDLEYVAKEADDAAMALDRFGDKAVRAGTSTGSFKRAGGQIGLGIAGAIGGAAALAASSVANMIGEKFKEEGKTMVFGALLKEGTFLGDKLRDLNTGLIIFADKLGLVEEGAVKLSRLGETGLRNLEYESALDAAVAKDKEIRQRDEVKRKEDLARIRAVTIADEEMAAQAERVHWAQSIKSVEELDAWYKSVISGAESQARAMEFGKDKAKDFEATLDALRNRRVQIEEQLATEREQSWKEQEALQVRLHKESVNKRIEEDRRLANEQIAIEKQKRDDQNKMAKDFADAGHGDVASEILGSQDPEAVEHQVKQNRRAEFKRRSADIDNAPDWAFSPRQKRAERQKVQKEIFGQPASASENNTAAGQLAQATIAETASRGGVDQGMMQFMAQAVQSKVEQNNTNAQMQSQIDKLTAMMTPKKRGTAQRTGRN